MSTTFFHTTDAADAILTSGFADSFGSYGLAEGVLSGVFVARTPSDVSDGAAGDQVLAVILPSSVDLAAFAIVEEGRPVWEWCIPAEVLNREGEVRLLSQSEVDSLKC